MSEKNGLEKKKKKKYVDENWRINLSKTRELENQCLTLWFKATLIDQVHDYIVG